MRDKIRETQKKVVKTMEEMKWAGVKSLKDKEWSIEEGLVLEKTVYMPEGPL